MKVLELAKIINGTLLTDPAAAEHEIVTGYCCDLLSRVMAEAPRDCAWMTVLTHTNTVAVAELAGIGCIVVPGGVAVPQPTLEKAGEEQIPVLSTELGSYEISWRLHEALKEE